MSTVQQLERERELALADPDYEPLDTRPTWRGWIHFAAFFTAIVQAAVLIPLAAVQSGRAALGVSIYCAAMLALFTFVGSWTNFFWPFIVLGSANPTLPVALQLLQASYFKDYSLIMAGVVVSTLPLILVFAVAGRHLVSGIMQGAVKG